MSNAKKKKQKSVNTVSVGQDSKGRFKKGNKLGKGNPSIRKTAHYKRLFDEAITDDLYKKVLQAVAKKAVKGDIQAAKIIIEQGAGKPQQYVEVSGDENMPVTVDFRFDVVNEN